MSNIKIGIIGLGYVGLPLSLAFALKYNVVGFDIDQQRVDSLNNRVDTNNEIELKNIKSTKQLSFSSQINSLAECNYYIITVPTPIDKDFQPDLSYLISASEIVGSLLKQGDVVIYESTVYPGCTEEECVPVLEKASGLKYNESFFVGYSPERINPGDKNKPITSIKKITSGSTPAVAQQIDELYKTVITAGTYLAPSIKVVEAAKAIENAQRDVNISFMNELALIFKSSSYQMELSAL